jgi:hypothetical protein
MATRDAGMKTVVDADRLRDEWLVRLGTLLDSVETWARELDWSTRRIEKKMDDHEIGKHVAPALLLQKEVTRVLLDPIARSAPGVEGVVDFYLMPGWDDIARLFFHDGAWHVYHAFPRRGTPVEPPSRPLSRETIREVLEDLCRYAEGAF